MTKEEKDRISSQRGMVMPNQLDSGLGMQGVPAFPSNFSNIGPSEQKAGLTRFAGGVPATMGIGGINSAYPSSLGLSGRDYAPMRDQSGQAIYGSPLRLPQAQAFGFGQPASFTGGLAPQTSIPIEGGPLSVGINRAQTAGQMGRTAIQTPYGTFFATDQQQANMNAPRSLDQQNSRTPQQQQALLDNIRKNAPALNQQRTDWVQDTIQQRRENPTTYKSPSGMAVAVPTNRFGAPIKAWMDQLGGEGRLNYGPKPASQTASAAATSSVPTFGNGFLASTGFGAMQRKQNEMMPPPIRNQSLFGGMGYAAAFGGGPQPESSMVATSPAGDVTRKRLFGTV
jgi:hypothetical protein